MKKWNSIGVLIDLSIVFVFRFSEFKVAYVNVLSYTAKIILDISQWEILVWKFGQIVQIVIQAWKFQTNIIIVKAYIWTAGHNFFSFFQDGHRIFQNGDFFHTEYTFEWNTVSDIMYISKKKHNCIYNRMLCFQLMFSVDDLLKFQCACAYFTTVYHQFDSLSLIPFNLNNWCKIYLVFLFIYLNIFQVIYLRMRKLFHI